MFRQGELRRQLEATERELANQKWVFERFLESPSWRMTYPVRWLARQARAFRDWVFKRNSVVEEKNLADQHHPGASRLPSSAEEGSPRPSLELKELLTSAYR